MFGELLKWFSFGELSSLSTEWIESEKIHFYMYKDNDSFCIEKDPKEPKEPVQVNFFLL